MSVAKNGCLKPNDSLLDPESFAALLEHTKGQIEDLSRGILEGEIPIHPYRYGKTENACTYCPYGQLCKFSEAFCGNAYRGLGKKKGVEFLEKMKEEGKS